MSLFLFNKIFLSFQIVVHLTVHQTKYIFLLLISMIFFYLVKFLVHTFGWHVWCTGIGYNTSILIVNTDDLYLCDLVIVFDVKKNILFSCQFCQQVNKLLPRFQKKMELVIIFKKKVSEKRIKSCSFLMYFKFNSIESI